MTGHKPPPSGRTMSSSGPEGEIRVELEQRRKKIDDEISDFRIQKEKEFRDFERDLRASRRRKINASPPPSGRMAEQDRHDKPPSRSSSSSALNLLAGHGAVKQSQTQAEDKKGPSECLPQRGLSSRAGPSVSQPVVLLDRLNIKGENAPLHSGRPRTPPTPTLLSRTLTRSSSSSSIATTPPQSKGKTPSTPATKSLPQSQTSPTAENHHDSFTGLFTPSYIRLLDSNAAPQYQSSSVFENNSIEDEAATAPSSFKSSTLSEVLTLTSSSFPPHVTISPGGHSHASKRAYTAPTVPSARKPSALRTVSGGTIVRKPKHVTFRLADSAIVEPSSSYEEGPSPELEDGKPSRSASGTRSPLRASKSQLHRSLSPDEEDAEAGVKPGMGMGDVIQRLNEYTVSEAAKNGEDLVLDVEANGGEEDEDEEEEEEEEDIPMEMPGHHKDSQEDDTDRNLTVKYHDHEDEPPAEVEEEGYFSPKNVHMSTMSPIVRGNSPLSPYREDDWAELSSSDKDRLLFRPRRHSDDSDIVRHRNNAAPATPTLDETGFNKGLGHSIDGGSGVGFFELDEELASPDAGQARPFDFDNDVDGADVDHIKDVHVAGLGLSITRPSEEPTSDEKKRWSGGSASKFGVGSLPIDIVRPSLSVSSSWVGTFGH